MSNFSIFDKRDLDALIAPFVSGMAEHITPIKYEAITPNIFALLFRTTGGDKTDHFFVSLEFDFVDSLEVARQIIEKWHGESIEFLQPELEIVENDPRIKVDETYYAVLAEVVPPIGSGYWSSNITIQSQAEAQYSIAQLPESYQASARKGVDMIYKNRPEAAISLYLNDNGTIEYFYQ